MILDTPTMMLEVVRTLSFYRYLCGDEMRLHAGIKKALDKHGVTYSHEVQATKADRFDFLIHDSIVIEAKIKGSISDALRQVERYCKLDQVAGVIVVAVRNWHNWEMPQEFNGKPLKLCRLYAQGF